MAPDQHRDLFRSGHLKYRTPDRSNGQFGTLVANCLDDPACQKMVGMWEVSEFEVVEVSTIVDMITDCHMNAAIWLYRHKDSSKKANQDKDDHQERQQPAVAPEAHRKEPNPGMSAINPINIDEGGGRTRAQKRKYAAEKDQEEAGPSQQKKRKETSQEAEPSHQYKGKGKERDADPSHQNQKDHRAGPSQQSKSKEKEIPLTARNGKGKEKEVIPQVQESSEKKDDRIPPKLIGWLCVEKTHDKRPSASNYRSRTISIVLAPEYRNMGLGKEAIDWALEWCFRKGSARTIHANIPSYNHAAKKIFTAAGFQREGCRRDALYQDGKWYDMFEYGILKRDWELRNMRPAAPESVGSEIVVQTEEGDSDEDIECEDYVRML